MIYRVGPRLSTVSSLGTRWISDSFWCSSITGVSVCVSERVCVYSFWHRMNVTVPSRRFYAPPKPAFQDVRAGKPLILDVNLNLIQFSRRASSHLKCDWLMRRASLVDGETETSTNMWPWESASQKHNSEHKYYRILIPFLGILIKYFREGSIGWQFLITLINKCH